MHRLLLLILGICGCVGATAQTSKEYAMMSRMTWSTYECERLGLIGGDLNEKQAGQLFNYATEQGRSFVNALIANKVKQEDVDSIAPSGMLMVLRGPSVDFILGRVYVTVGDYVANDILNPEKNAASFDSKLRKMRAKNEFQKRNCALIGSKK